jgi:hypothetical protein
MIGHNVWRFMVDTEDGVVARNLERAMNDKVDVVFDFYYAAHDRWYTPSRRPPASKSVSSLLFQVREQDVPWSGRRCVHFHHRHHRQKEGRATASADLQGETNSLPWFLSEKGINFLRYR